MSEPCALLDLFADAIDDLVHEPNIQAEDDYFGMLESVEQTDGVGETRPLFIFLDADDMPTVLPHVVEQLLVVVIGRRR